MVNNFKSLKNDVQKIESIHNSVRLKNPKSRRIMEKALDYLCLYFEKVDEVEKLETQK